MARKPKATRKSGGKKFKIPTQNEILKNMGHLSSSRPVL